MEHKKMPIKNANFVVYLVKICFFIRIYVYNPPHENIDEIYF